MKSDFEERRQARIERYEDRAARARREADGSFKRADQLSERFYMGQPILIGHHSEKGARRDQERMHNAMRKGIDLRDKANHYEARAEAAANNNAIFSDDPNATEKLAEKIERLERRQQLMRDANKLVRKNDLEGLMALGFSEARARGLFEPDFCGRKGFADYELSNNNANIRRLKLRLADIQKTEAMETTEIELEGGIKIVQNVEDNRTQIFFPGKPDEATRAKLKSHGFRWSPYNGCWQRHLSGQAKYWAEQIVKEVQS